MGCGDVCGGEQGGGGAAIVGIEGSCDVRKRWSILQRPFSQLLVNPQGQMRAIVDGNQIDPNALWWPAMNFGQFRWDAPIGHYELELPRPEFVHRLATAYVKCACELRKDDDQFPEEASFLHDLGYPTLDAVLKDEAAA